jgi:geranylgeranyl diphosphate synthase type II
MGGIVGGAAQKDAQLLYEFGEQLGLAFQIQDDILDLYGEGAQVGKLIGGDVLANKKTLLSISAKRAASQSQLADLHEIENTTDPQTKIEQTQKLYTELGAHAYCVAQMEFHHNRALKALENMELSKSKDELLELAHFLFTRAY